MLSKLIGLAQSRVTHTGVAVVVGLVGKYFGLTEEQIAQIIQVIMLLIGGKTVTNSVAIWKGGK